jgi:predicted AlkP superfamily pyrophosphatase or phosphodiesterase
LRRSETQLGRKLVIVHGDGLGADSLEKAIREARMPFVERLMRSESYEINR